MSFIHTHPGPRHHRIVNWIGLWTLTRKETERFLKVMAQTIVAPVMSTVLFYLVFVIALHSPSHQGADPSFVNFLVPGLVMMSMAQNSFANTSSSLLIAKVQGNIVDVLMPPLSAAELTIGYMVGGIARGIVVGLVSIGALSFFVELQITHPFWIVYFGFMGSMLLSLLGIIGGIWAEKFDHMAAVQNFIIMPATFLSGTFYSTNRLPPFWYHVSHFNPFFYMIDGFRYGFIGSADGSLLFGSSLLGVTNLILLGMAYRMFKTGYKIKT